MTRMTRFGMTFLLALAIPTLMLAGQKEKTGTKNDNSGTPVMATGGINLEKEIAMGRQLSVEFERTAILLDDPAVKAYTNRIVQKIVRNSDARVPFTIKVVDSQEVNAFAFPGGFFYLNAGLILAVDDEAELAGVMAHEIAHVAAHHGTNNESRAKAANPLVSLGNATGYGMQEVDGFLIPTRFFQYSREAEADHLGIQYMLKAGYDPNAMIRFFEKIQAKQNTEPGSMSKMFQTHPPTADRIRMAQQNIRSVVPEGTEHIVTAPEFQKIKARLGELESLKRRQGAVSSPKP